MRRRTERGAAAVEFALVAPILFLVLFGIIDYGVWFADQLAVNQSAASGARTAATRAAGDTAWGTQTCGPWTPDAGSGTSGPLQSLACAIRQSAQTLDGPVYVRIRVLDGTRLDLNPPLDASTTGSVPNWKAGNAVRVCLLQLHDSLTQVVPLPGSRLGSHADMPVEDPIGGFLLGGYQPLPGGASWPSWC